MRDVEKDWTEFWEPIVAPDGVLDLEQVKKELSDFSMVMDEVGKVYMHISGGKISKITTHAHHLIVASDDMCTQACNEEIADQAERRAARLEARMPEIEAALEEFAKMVGKREAIYAGYGDGCDDETDEALDRGEGIAKGKLMALIREVAG